MGQNWQEWAAEIREFCEARDWDQYHGPKDLAIGLITESSELLELFRFQNEAQSQALLDDAKTREMVADELADCLFFLVRFAQRNNFDLGQALKNKMVKNGRKYPVDKALGNNQKYDQL